MFKKKRKSKKQEPFIPSTVKTKKMNAWIGDLKQLKIQERAALFAAFYVNLQDGAISELMQTPIESVRGYVKSAAGKLEKIVEKHQQGYINETNFKKFFDEDFGSTYTMKRRLKQVQMVAQIQNQQSKKLKRPVPKWVPIAIACFVFFSTLATPFAYHQSKKIPYLNEEVMEVAILLNSTYQPYYQTISDNYKSYIEHVLYIASLKHFIYQLDLDMSSYEAEIEILKKQFMSYSDLGFERDQELLYDILEKFDIDYEEYQMLDVEMQALFNIVNEQLTEIQREEMYNYFDVFINQYREEVDKLYARYAKYDATEKLTECQVQRFRFVKENEESDEAVLYSHTPEATQLCILPNGDVTYKFIDNFYPYFEQTIFELENNLEASYNPFNYYLFYDYLAEKDQLTQIEKEFMQMTQILAYAYEQVYPGWIEQVPVLKSEDLVFSN